MNPTKIKPTQDREVDQLNFDQLVELSDRQYERFYETRSRKEKSELKQRQQAIVDRVNFIVGWRMLVNNLR